MKYSIHAVLLVLPLFLFGSCVGIEPHKTMVFQWKFSDSRFTSSLPTCEALGITIQPFDLKVPNATTGVPPYYLMSFEVGGTPKTTLIGENATSLSWTVSHAVGAQLMLSVVDSQGSTGGIPPQLHRVVAGQSTQCVETDGRTDFSVSANVTDSVHTCEPWGLRIKGGTPPYNITLAAINSPNITNTSTAIGTMDDAYTYINRAAPGTQLLAAVADLTGRWATGTPIVKTTGSTDADCPGLNSVSGVAAELDAASSPPGMNNRTRAIIGVCVTLAILLILGGIGAIWYMRRKKRPQQIERGQDTAPDPFLETGSNVLSINQFLTAAPQSPKSPLPDSSISPSSSLSYGTVSASERLGIAQRSDTVTSTSTSATRPTSASSNSRPGFAAFPSSSVRRSAKASEASSPSDPFQEGASGIERSQSELVPSTGNSSRWPIRSDTVASGQVSAEVQAATGEIIIQHHDGGMVRELPPPYADRGNQGTGPQF